MAGLVGRRGRSQGMKRPEQGRNKGETTGDIRVGQGGNRLGKEGKETDTMRALRVDTAHQMCNRHRLVTEGSVRQEEGDRARSDQLSDQTVLCLVWGCFVALFSSSLPGSLHLRRHLCLGRSCLLFQTRSSLISPEPLKVMTRQERKSRPTIACKLWVNPALLFVLPVLPAFVLFLFW